MVLNTVTVMRKWGEGDLAETSATWREREIGRKQEKSATLLDEGKKIKGRTLAGSGRGCAAGRGGRALVTVGQKPV